MSNFAEYFTRTIYDTFAQILWPFSFVDEGGYETLADLSDIDEGALESLNYKRCRRMKLLRHLQVGAASTTKASNLESFESSFDSTRSEEVIEELFGPNARGHWTIQDARAPSFSSPVATPSTSTPVFLSPAPPNDDERFNLAAALKLQNEQEPVFIKYLNKEPLTPSDAKRYEELST